MRGAALGTYTILVRILLHGITISPRLHAVLRMLSLAWYVMSIRGRSICQKKLEGDPLNGALGLERLAQLLLSLCFRHSSLNMEYEMLLRGRFETLVHTTGLQKVGASAMQVLVKQGVRALRLSDPTSLA